MEWSELVSGGFMECVHASFGEGRCQIYGAAVFCGEDVQLSFTGGTRPHIGAVSLALYEPERDSATVSTICAYGHRDDQLSASCAKSTASVMKRTAAVSVGIHIDNASPQELNRLCANFEECRKRLLRKAMTMVRKNCRTDEQEETGVSRNGGKL